LPSTAELAEQAKADQLAVRAVLLKELLDLWALLDPENVQGSGPEWLREVVPLILRYRDLSVARAEDSYNEMRREAVPGAGVFRLPLVDDPDLRDLQKTLLITGPGRVAQLQNQGKSPAQAKRDAVPLLSGSASKAVLDAGREAVMQGVEKDPKAIAYARLPSPGACGWCLMLSSRGAVYSARTVVKTTSRSQKQGSGKSFHDFCSCVPFAVYSRDTEMPPIIDEAERLWIESTQGMSGKAALAAYRVAVGETPGTTR
jgi:hypothetical protein